ncbi:HAD hydrolase-like protein [Rhizobium leguminosarum]|uniref:HAD family hydrolase n=1 Tax=Rhizobium leguminosarum TaxID=384 RepID=UPI0013BCE94F|nr:HAD family hydrolase [Rhizobium leguminosarum]NEI59440.1 HAD hydrolase-like protein [Rhizobium leguminosarum]NEI88280.1 HAD hydrolase-like protein [Rhizobium leguminosarum]
MLVLVDADNTLWDTDGVFAQAQLSLLSSVENALRKGGPSAGQLEYVRSFDQALAEQHHLGLRYPPRLLIDALAFGLQGSPQQDAVRRAWNDGFQSGLDRETVSQIERAFFDKIAVYPSLLNGVPEGLLDLASSGATTVVLTEGSRKRVMRTIEHHRLGKFIDRVFEAPKTVRMFERVKHLARDGQSIYMIGDQLTRDIRPANEAGLKTIYVPGAFQPKWEAEVGTVATFEAATLDAAVSLLLQSEGGTRSPQLASGKPGYLRVQNRT